MIKLLCLPLILIFSLGVQAGTFTDQESFTFSVKSVTSGFGRVITACQTLQSGGETCQTFPSKRATLLGFQGTPQDWKNYFDRCFSFRSANTVSSATIGVAVFVLSAPVGWWQSILASVQGANVNFMVGSPYPDVDPELVDFAPESTSQKTLAGIYNYILNDTSDELFIPSQKITDVVTVLRACSTGVDSWLIEHQHNVCMRGCHSGKK